MINNPYQAPASQQDPTLVGNADLSVSGYVQALMRWLLICSVSAIPSFILGMQFSMAPSKVGAMIMGVVVFAFLFALIERTFFVEWAKTNPTLYKTLWIGYGTRIVVSVVFPVGCALDMFVGLLSVTISQLMIPTEGELSTFVAVLATTLLQGVLVNLVLVGYMSLIYGVQHLARTN